MFNVEDKTLVRPKKDIHQLYPLKYPWAMKFYKKIIANLWFPEEINMSKDVPDFATLNPAEKHMFVNVLAYLTTADMGAIGNVSTALMGKIPAPELQMCLGGQVFNECVHSASYAHAIETLGLDQNIIYNRYAEVPEIGNKIKALTARTASICSQDDSLEDDQDLFEFIHDYFFFSAIFEGTSFMSSFNPILSLKNSSNRMGGTFEQLRFIRREEHLHIALGLKIIKEICKETGMQLNTRIVQDMFNDAYAQEEQYIGFILRENILGYNKDDHLAQFRNYANLRASFVGVPKPFETSRELVWLGETIDSNKEQNFFEGTVSEYQVGADLGWEKANSSMEEVMSWKETKPLIAPVAVGAVCTMEEGCESCQ